MLPIRLFVNYIYSVISQKYILLTYIELTIHRQIFNLLSLLRKAKVIKSSLFLKILCSFKLFTSYRLGHEWYKIIHGSHSTHTIISLFLTISLLGVYFIHVTIAQSNSMHEKISVFFCSIKKPHLLIFLFWLNDICVVWED